MRRATFWLALLGAVAGCARPAGSSEAAVCGPSAVETAGWQEVRASAFVLQLPPRFRNDRVQGIDSEVARWSAGADTVSYDYGAYAGRSSTDGASDLVTCRGEIGGHQSVLDIYRDDRGRYVVSAHWPDLGAPAFAGSERPASLTLHGVVATAGAQRELVTAFRGVRFTGRTDAP
jgi:hypothetical protein